MKVHTCNVLAGFVSALCLSSQVTAAFAGLLQQSKSPIGPVTDPTVPGPAGTYFVYNIWAAFTSPTDRLLSVTQATITMRNGAVLFQHGFGTSTAPNAALFGIAPALQFDSFVTIGLKNVPVGGSDSTSLEPGAAFTPTGFSGGWFNSNPDNDQGAPGAHGTPTGAVAGVSYVLIAQLTMRNPQSLWGFSGAVLVAWKPAGATDATFSIGTFAVAACLPAPGALGLLGVAGLSARRRRGI